MDKVRIEIHEDKVYCSCGFYDKSFRPFLMAKTHNAKKHAGHLEIFDTLNNVELDHMTGDVVKS